MITSNIIYRVFKVRTEQGTATAFTIDHDGKQYLVTARHTIDRLPQPYRIDIYWQEDWHRLPLGLTGLSPISDVAVLAPRVQLSPTFPLPPTDTGLAYGQDVYFIGFPYDIMGGLGNLLEGRPLPLVKRGCLSAFAKGANDESLLYLDGHNNPGFSGAPVVWREGQSTEFRVCGVVSGYKQGAVSTPLGDSGAEIELLLNAGIVVCSSIRYAIDEIEKNSNGFALTDTLPMEPV